MKKILFYILLTFTSISYAQVFQNFELKIKNSNHKLIHSNTAAYSLNLEFFELCKHSLNGPLDHLCTKKSELISNFFIFPAKGEFFLRTMFLADPIENQKDIYDYVDPKYLLRSIG